MILEKVFVWPGVGQVYLESISMRDYPFMLGNQGIAQCMFENNRPFLQALGACGTDIILTDDLQHACTEITLPALFGGAMILEKVFVWPGVGQVYLESISMRDYPFMAF
jgi:ABC-type dipeptide/oligopeptide/nickel transport system permease component